MTIREKVLIVEDEKSIAHFISTILSSNGYDPLLARSGAEAMTMINRVLNRDPVENDDLLPDMCVWSDNRPGAWYYSAVQEATNSHEYKWSGDIEHWIQKLPERDWDALQR